MLRIYRTGVKFLMTVTLRPAPPLAALFIVAIVGLMPAAPAVAAQDPAPTPPSGAASGVDPSQVSGPIPETVNEMLVQLKTRTEQVGQLVEHGSFGALWVPAFQARDLAIALEAHLGELIPAGRDTAEPAIQRLVRTAWLLDAFGDIGNRQQILEAYSIFASAVADVVSAFTTKP
jgi:hypothetical protein